MTNNFNSPENQNHTASQPKKNDANSAQIAPIRKDRETPNASSSSFDKNSSDKDSSATKETSSTQPQGLTQGHSPKQDATATKDSSSKDSKDSSAKESSTQDKNTDKLTGLADKLGAGDLAAVAKDWTAEVGQRAETLNQDIRGFIQKKPVAAALIAVGVGFVANLVAKQIKNSAPGLGAKNLANKKNNHAKETRSTS